MKAKRFFGSFFLGAILILVGCEKQAATEPTQGEVIFLADPAEIQAGNCTMLVWDASTAFEVRLDGVLVTLAGNQEVCPTENTIFVLEADLGTSVERQEVEVKVIGAGEQSEMGVTPEPEEQTGTPGPVMPGIPAYQADAWVALGNPPGDLGYDIRYNFSNHDIWYVTDATAGFHISTDRGLTWEPSNSGITSFEGSINVPVFSATVDPHNPNTIWIGTQFTGHIYKSTDGGAQWIEMDQGVEPNIGLHFRGFTVDPRSSDIVYAMAEVETHVFTDAGKPVPYPELPCQGGRIYRTTDGGENWSLIWEGEALARYLWIDPTNTDVLYASTGIFDRCPLNMPPGTITPWQAGGLGVLKSTDGGKTWIILGKENGLEMLHVNSLYMKPDDPQTLLAGTGAQTLGGEGEPPGIVYLTRDGGESWQAVVTGDHTIGAVEYCEQDTQVAYAAGVKMIYRSEDGGLTWVSYGDSTRGTWGPPGLFPGTPIDIQIDPDDPNCDRIFINNYIGGNFLSTDGGKTWSLATDGYSGAQVLGLAASSTDPSLVYAGVRLAMFASDDSGETWTSLSNPELLLGVLTLALDPSDDQHLLLVEGEHLHLAPPVYESHDGGTTWKKIFSLVPPPGISDADWGRMKFWDIAFAPSDPQIVYAATLNDPMDFDAQAGSDYLIGVGVYRSDDGGTTWAPANDASIANLGFASIAVHPFDSQTVYAGTHGGSLYKTTDGGRSWTLLQSGLDRFFIFRAIAIDPRDPEIVFAGGKGGLYVTTDGGGTWQQVTAGIAPEESITAIVIDPSHEGVIYLGTVRGGVLYSIDGGQNFHALAQGLDLTLGNLTIRTLALSPDGSILYAGTIGQGVYRLGTPVTADP